MTDELPARLGSVSEGAAMVGVSPRTVRRYISAGRLTGYRVGPRLLKVDLDELRTLVHPIPTVGS